MTTVEGAHLFDLYCEGKSSRQLYHLACEQRGVMFNKQLIAQLSARENDFSMKEFTIAEENFTGATGCDQGQQAPHQGGPGWTRG